MIQADESVFPNNIVDLLATRFQLIDDDLFVIKRPLRVNDLAQSIGVFSSMWTPDPESYVIRGNPLGSPIPAASEPTISRYVIGIQALVKDMEEERGLATHSVLSTMLRAMLYRDDPLRVGLAALNAEVSGVKERTMRWGVTTQRFLSNDIGNNEWMFLSTVEFWLDTEIY